MNHLNEDAIIKGVFLLILSVMGNFIAETLGCRTQKLLSDNMYAKHFVVLILIYFAIGFTNKSSAYNPLVHIKSAFVIWIGFILFTKMEMKFTIIAFIIFIIIYLLNDFKNFYQENNSNQENNKKIKMVNSSIKMLEKMVLGLLIVGFIIYSSKQYLDRGNNFSILKLIFGSKKCDSID
tara:strand:+ start:370 stop:906 length:537 start_codon:yes stop_codon:yes gene_type:complete